VPRGRAAWRAARCACTASTAAARRPASRPARRPGHGAILFGDLNDADSEIARRVRELATRQLRADLGLDPGVRYQGL
jgi:tetrathionate reductase subunit B